MRNQESAETLGADPPTSTVAPVAPSVASGAHHEIMRAIGRSRADKTLLPLRHPVNHAAAAVDPRKAPYQLSCRMHILVAEDSPLNQKLARRILAQEGHTAVVAADGRQVLAAFERESFDLILMDVQMPELGGLETTVEIRRREAASGRHTPIVALTASAMKGDRERCLEAGMDAYVAKPLDKEKLLRLLYRLGASRDQIVVPRRHDPVARDPVARDPVARDPVARDPVAHDLARTAPMTALAPPVFDPERTLSRCAGDPCFAREVVDLFLATASELAAGLHRAAAAADAHTVHHLAHRLKGAATFISGGRVEELARQLSQMGQDGDLGDSGSALAKLDDEIALLEGALVTFRSELESGVG